MPDRRSFVLAMGLAACVASGTFSCAAQKLVWGGFEMPRARSGCFLENNATDLEHELWNFGWKARGNNFPAIAWEKQMVAIVVPTREDALKPTDVGLSDGKVVVHLRLSQQHYDGVVVQIPKSWGQLADCRLQYPNSDTPDQIYPMIVIAASTDSISPDEPADASPSPPDENHALPPTATLPETEPPQ